MNWHKQIFVVFFNEFKYNILIYVYTNMQFLFFNNKEYSKCE